MIGLLPITKMVIHNYKNKNCKRYSPFYDWVTISKDEGVRPTEYGKEIELELDPV